MIRIVTGLILTFFTVAFFSCNDDDLEKRRENELNKLNEYIRTHYPELEPTPSGLYFIELEEGTGDSIKINDRVQLFYKMWTLDSTLVAETGPYEPIELRVYPPDQLSTSPQSVERMRGLNEGLLKMKDKGKARLIFSSNLGFGQYGISTIGGFTSLIMEVEIYKVYPAETANDENEEVE
jgi:hypothetical protein